VNLNYKPFIIKHYDSGLHAGSLLRAEFFMWKHIGTRNISLFQLITRGSPLGDFLLWHRFIGFDTVSYTIRDLGYNLIAVPKFIFPLLVAFFIFWFYSLRLLFFVDFSFQGSAFYHWRRFRDSDLRNTLDYLLRVPVYVRQKVQAIYTPVIDRYGEEYMAAGSEKQWNFWWLPDLLLKYLGKKHMYSAIFDLINKDFKKKKHIGKKLGFKLGLNAWYADEDKDVWSWFFGKITAQDLVSARERRIARKEPALHRGMNFDFFSFPKKIFGADLWFYMRNCKFDFLNYYLGVENEDVHSLNHRDVHSFGYFIAYSYRRLINLKYLDLYLAELNRLPIEFSNLAEEKTSYAYLLHDYFFKLDKNFFNHKCPHWSFHRDPHTFMFLPTKISQQVVVSKKPLVFKNVDVIKNWWQLDIESVGFESLGVFFFMVPVLYYHMLFMYMGIRWYFSYPLYLEWKIFSLSFLTCFDFVSYLWEMIGYNTLELYDRMHTANSPGFKFFWSHSVYTLLRQELTYAVKWESQFGIFFLKKAKALFNWNYASHFFYNYIFFFMPIRSVYYYKPIYTIFFFLVFLFLLIIFIKSYFIIFKNSYRIIKSKKNRILSFRHIHYTLLYFKLKDSMRQGFLWFWR
jgi:hypothetical protein